MSFRVGHTFSEKCPNNHGICINGVRANKEDQQCFLSGSEIGFGRNPVFTTKLFTGHAVRSLSWTLG